ncbi:MAG: methionyl-tRNA formyltransferase [Dehalococcoidia bacterium]|nr:methionyl-tRNA formyltransferase [Dehalococcoidia bacterium]
MRIVLIGQAAFGEKVLEALVARGEQVVGVYTTPDAPGGRENPLKTLASSHNIPVSQPTRMRDAGVYDEFVKYDPELTVMAFVTDIVPARLLNYPKYGTIQYHPSLLPLHRGGSAINWAIINGDTRTGLSIFWPDKGIDTGPVLLQKEVEIAPDDTTGSVYFNKLFPIGVDAMIEAIDLVKQGKAPRLAQDESQATYEGWCGETECVIDWSKPGQTVFNLIRGCNPQPGATTYLKGSRLKIFDAEYRPGASHEKAGEIVEVGSEGILIAARGGTILAKRVQPDRSPKIKATDYATSSGLRPGDRLG